MQEFRWAVAHAGKAVQGRQLQQSAGSLEAGIDAATVQQTLGQTRSSGACLPGGGGVEELRTRT